MSNRRQSSDVDPPLSRDFARLLGVRRSMRLRRIMRQTRLPPEVLIDLALELLDIASTRLLPSPVQRQAVGLGAARWRNASPEEKSEAMRRAAKARWAKHRRNGKPRKPE